MKKLLYIIPVIVLMAAGCSSSPAQDNQSQQPSGQNQQGNPSNSGQQNSGTDNMSQSPNTWTGTLQMSDNKAKGNLMIMVDGHNVYINTGRDFKSLVGKEVNITYKGTLDSFTLGNISAK